MDAPNVLVIGAGSIGRRHARNLRTCGAHVTITDPDEDRARAGGADRTVPFADEVPGGFDGVVIAAPTSAHRTLLESALTSDAAILVEKPVVTDGELDQVSPTLVSEGDRVMVGYNLRLHAPVERLMRLVHSGEIGAPTTARLWFGSWLPSWRPGVDYRSTYSSRANLGGGILLDAIHEIDLALWLTGSASFNVRSSIVDRRGTLEIDVEDTVIALLVHESGLPVDISLDYLSRRYRRGIEVVGTDATVRLDWSRGVLELEDADRLATEHVTTDIELSYEREAKHFLDVVRGDAKPIVDGPTGLASVALVRAIRDAAT